MCNITNDNVDEQARGRRKRPKRNRDSHSDSNVATMTLAILLVGLLLIMAISIAYSNPAELYMYEVMKKEESYPIIEYLVPEDPRDKMVDRNDTAHLPAFLTSSTSGPRVVEFYAPWCPHCQHFKPHYIDIARKVTAVGERVGQKINFYAVSCVAHDPVCKNQGVHGYPSIHAYPAGVINGTKFSGWEVHPFRLLTAMGIELPEGFEIDLREDSAKEISKDVKSSSSKGYVPRRVRDKKELYADAFLSFDFGLRQGVFMNTEVLSNSTKDALREWLVLLQDSLPPVWKIQGMIRAITKDFDEAVKSEKAFLEHINPHRPEHTDWSSACTHEDGLPGYTCGLWELFHIMTVGVVEWNALSDSEWNMIPTLHAADTLRNYIANFFGCEVCQQNFLTAYDACSFDRCTRLHSYSDDPDPDEWKQLSLWLWETHNAVNVRLLHERAQREGRTVPVTLQDEINVKWPSTQDCYACWRKDGTWDEHFVYLYLRISYWWVCCMSIPCVTTLTCSAHLASAPNLNTGPTIA